jgi:protein-disulfide isomerase
MKSERYGSESVENGDVIVIKKSWVVTGAVGLAFFILGGVLGYVLATSVFQRNAAQARLDAAPIAAQGAGQQPAALPQRVQVSDGGDPAIGPADAPVTIVEFSDFQCPYCKTFRDQTLDALLERYGDQVRFVFRDFPLSQLHPFAQKAAEASECANEQGHYWEMHDLLFANSPNLSEDALKGFAEQLGLDMEQFNECLDSGRYADEVTADLQEGMSYGVTGTPTFFINGIRLVGAQPLANFQAIIDQELAER